MKFTIITVAYNEGRGIAKTIQSVIGQHYENIEYLIIDGNSSDRTIEIAEKLAQEAKCDIKIYSEEDFGIYNAMNRGITRATGDFTIFMNAGDSFWNRMVLSDIASQINENGEAIYYGQAYLMKNGKCKGVKELSNFGKSEHDALMKGYMPVHQSIAVPTVLLKRHYFNEEYKIRADYDWLMRAYKEGIRFVNMGFPVCKYDCSGLSSRASYKKILKAETLMIRRKVYPLLGRIYELRNQWKI